MHLSTSSFEREKDCLAAPGRPQELDSILRNSAVRRATITLLMVLTGVFGTAEIAARALFPRFSHIQRRIVGDQEEARSIGTSAGNDAPSMLVVGNSLLLYGLDYPRFTAALSPDIRPVRYAIENTNYLDWYYGLKGLFSEGVRPTQVVLCLNLGQTVERRILGDYSARHLFHAGDLLAVGREAGLDNTQISGLFFAHWSAFYGDRAHIRNFLLNASDPGYAHAMFALAQAPANPPPADWALQESRVRLRAIVKLCQDYHVGFVLVIPPSLNTRDQSLAKAGNLEHVSVDIPVPLGSLGPEYFLDGFHLNSKGASLFTNALAQDLKTRFQRAGTEDGAARSSIAHP